MKSDNRRARWLILQMHEEINKKEIMRNLDNEESFQQIELARKEMETTFTNAMENLQIIYCEFKAKFEARFKFLKENNEKERLRDKLEAEQQLLILKNMEASEQESEQIQQIKQEKIYDQVTVIKKEKN